MKKTKMKILAGLTGISLLLNPIATYAEDAGIPLTVLDGKLVSGRVFMPLRAAGDAIGAKIGWNQKTQTATVEKDGTVFVAKVGPFVKLFNNRVYVQFREFSETFFEQDTILWENNYLQASSAHFLVQTAPLKNAEALKIAAGAVAGKKDRKQFLKETDGFFVNEYVTWNGLNQYTARYNSEWNDTRDYYASTIEVVMTKSGDRWSAGSFRYYKEQILPPH
ncbi:copper amine oxidase N-terminal domain-containing protein [Paenibacillus sp. MMO-58]|uniref:copper amine oxidase N-terminal domain-containing protein n=1 Tax=Paenibacillus sp. MMO-58 TaxID=3081290 RepID=UPI0030169185